MYRCSNVQSEVSRTSSIQEQKENLVKRAATGDFRTKPNKAGIRGLDQVNRG
jgi:hypothetical protein